MYSWLERNAAVTQFTDSYLLFTWHLHSWAEEIIREVYTGVNWLHIITDNLVDGNLHVNSMTKSLNPVIY